MSSVQDRLVLGALLLAESAWLYVLFGVAGAALGGDGSPLGWAAVLAILLSAVVLARLLQRVAMAYVFHMVFGIVVLYLTLGTQATLAGQGLDLGWPGKVGKPGLDDLTLRAVLGSIFAVGLWWRGGRLAATDFPVDSLGFSFKLGMLAMALASIVDIAHSADLNVFPMVFVFFASGLAGLSIGHLLPATQQSEESRTWPRVILGVVLAVVLVGLALSLVQRGILAAIARGAGWVLSPIFDLVFLVVFYVFIFPMAFIIDWSLRGLKALISALFGTQQAQLLEPPQGLAQQLAEGEQQAGPVAEALLRAIEWTVIAVVVLIALLILARAFQRRLRARQAATREVRESVREDADPAYDLADLLFNVIPRRLRKRKQRRRFRLPEGDPAIVDVFRIYFGLLVLAEKKGLDRPPWATPAEFQATLEAAFPPDLVRDATAAFNRACYGHYPAPPEQIAQMRASLERLALEMA